MVTKCFTIGSVYYTLSRRSLVDLPSVRAMIYRTEVCYDEGYADNNHKIVVTDIQKSNSARYV